MYLVQASAPSFYPFEQTHREMVRANQGDHVLTLKKLAGPLRFWHHGIVSRCDKETGYWIIHFTTPNSGNRNPAVGRIMETNWEHFMNGSVSRKWHVVGRSDKEGHTREQALARARSCIGLGGYNLLTRNCEHFAFWCTMGSADSHQVQRTMYTWLAVWTVITAATAGTLALVASRKNMRWKNELRK